MIRPPEGQIWATLLNISLGYAVREEAEKGHFLDAAEIESHASQLHYRLHSST